ncbi:MAG: hypothetical protein ACJ8F7_06315 [Gemmataceae bacterium]
MFRRLPLILAGFALGLAALAPSASADDFATAPDTPNVLVEVNNRLIAALAETPVDRVEPVRDNILDTEIVGTGHTVGQVSVEVVPNADVAVFDLLMTARTDSQTVGYHGPVQLYSSNVSAISARKRVWFDGRQLLAYSAYSANQTDSTLCDIETKFHHRMIDNFVRKAAYRKYDKSHAEANWISEQHVNQRVAAGLDRDAGAKLESANGDFERRVRGPLRNHTLYPERLSTRTTPTTLDVGARLAEPQPEPITPFPTVDPRSDAAVRVHQSLLNAGATRALAGKTYTQLQFRTEFADLLGAPKDTNLKQDVAITFAQRRPVEFAFDNNLAKVTIRGTKYLVHEENEDRELGPMNITATYKLEKTDLGFRATRQGELEIYPPDFVKGRDKLTTSQVAQRRLLQRHLADSFQELFELDEIILPDSLKRAGPLVPTQFQTTRGWLVLGVRRAG